MEGIVGFVSCLLCAFPFFVVGHYQKDSKEPIAFWSGDRTLKDKVKNIQGYNRDISKLYIKIFWVFVCTGILCVIYFWAGIVCLCIECTVGIYVAWRMYKNILSRHG